MRKLYFKKNIPGKGKTWPGFQSLWLPAIAHGMISTPTALERWNGPKN